MPCTSPPCTWPSTIIGLMMVPKSSTAREAVDLDLAGLLVDFHLADVGAGREGEVGRVVEGGLVQARLQLVQRVVVRHVGRQRHLAEGDLLVGALHGELAVGELDVGIARLHQVGRDLLGLGLDLVQRLHDGRAADARSSASRRCPCRRARGRCRRAPRRRSRPGCPGAPPPPARRWFRGPGRGCASR